MVDKFKILGKCSSFLILVSTKFVNFLAFLVLIGILGCGLTLFVIVLYNCCQNTPSEVENMYNVEPELVKEIK